MGTIFLHTLRESMNRRFGLALLVAPALIVAMVLWWVRFKTQPGGVVMANVGTHAVGRAATFVPSMCGNLLQMSNSVMLFLAIFATAPLLTAFLEKGWIELLLSKGVARWKILLGRYAGALVLFLATLLVLDLIPALYFWARAGVAPGRFSVALLFVLLSFATVLATMALGAVLHGHAALPIMVAFLQVMVSAVLADRKRMYAVITAKWAQWLLDWAYRILPKNHELAQLGASYLRSGTINEWGFVWTSALFMAGTLGLAFWWFYRKSY